MKIAVNNPSNPFKLSGYKTPPYESSETAVIEILIDAEPDFEQKKNRNSNRKKELSIRAT